MLAPERGLVQGSWEMMTTQRRIARRVGQRLAATYPNCITGRSG